MNIQLNCIYSSLNNSVILWILIQTVLLHVFHPNYQHLFWEQTNPKAAHMHFNLSWSLSQQNHLGHISFSTYITFGYATGLKFKIYYLRTSYKTVLRTLLLNLSLLTFGNLLCVQPRLSEKSKHITSVSTGDLYPINNAASSDSPWKAPVLEKEGEWERVFKGQRALFPIWVIFSISVKLNHSI